MFLTDAFIVNSSPKFTSLLSLTSASPLNSFMLFSYNALSISAEIPIAVKLPETPKALASSFIPLDPGIKLAL